MGLHTLAPPNAWQVLQGVSASAHGLWGSRGHRCRSVAAAGHVTPCRGGPTPPSSRGASGTEGWWTYGMPTMRPGGRPRLCLHIRPASPLQSDEAGQYPAHRTACGIRTHFSGHCAVCSGRAGSPGAISTAPNVLLSARSSVVNCRIAKTRSSSAVTKTSTGQPRCPLGQVVCRRSVNAADAPPRR
jgi:hypothetical protein